NNQDGLDLGSERLDLIVDFPLVQPGDLEHQIIQLPRLISDCDHLQHHGRENPGGGCRTQHAFAALDTVAHLLNAPADVVVVVHAGDICEPLHHGHAALDCE